MIGNFFLQSLSTKTGTEIKTQQFTGEKVQEVIYDVRKTKESGTFCKVQIIYQSKESLQIIGVLPRSAGTGSVTNEENETTAIVNPNIVIKQEKRKCETEIKQEKLRIKKPRIKETIEILSSEDEDEDEPDVDLI